MKWNIWKNQDEQKNPTNEIKRNEMQLWRGGRWTRWKHRWFHFPSCRSKWKHMRKTDDDKPTLQFGKWKFISDEATDAERANSQQTCIRCTTAHSTLQNSRNPNRPVVPIHRMVRRANRIGSRNCERNVSKQQQQQIVNNNFTYKFFRFAVREKRSWNHFPSRIFNPFQQCSANIYE